MWAKPRSIAWVTWIQETLELCSAMLQNGAGGAGGGPYVGKIHKLHKLFVQN